MKALSHVSLRVSGRKAVNSLLLGFSLLFPNTLGKLVIDFLMGEGGAPVGLSSFHLHGVGAEGVEWNGGKDDMWSALADDTELRERVLADSFMI